MKITGLFLFIQPRSGLAAFGGVAISGEIYAWTAVFILPVNSALNPFLYTFSAYMQHRVTTILFQYRVIFIYLKSSVAQWYKAVFDWSLSISHWVFSRVSDADIAGDKIKMK